MRSGQDSISDLRGGRQVLPLSRHGTSGTVVTHSPPTFEVGSSKPRPYVGKLVAAYQWSAVYSTEL